MQDDSLFDALAEQLDLFWMVTCNQPRLHLRIGESEEDREFVLPRKLVWCR